MKLRSFASLAIVPVLVLVTPPSGAAPPVGTAGPARPSAGTAPKVKGLARIEVKNAAAVPGETRNLEATLTNAGGAPLAGKPVVFRIEGKNGTTVPGGAIVCGTDATDANGKAKLAFVLPELAQGAYTLKAIFGGDDDNAGATGSGNLGMVKGITKFEMGDLIWGTYKNEPGPKTGTVIIKLIRQADGKTLAKQFNITMNGTSWNIGGSSSDSGIHSMALVPLGANSWNVKVQFNGDAANQATSGERTYNKPAN